MARWRRFPGDLLLLRASVRLSRCLRWAGRPAPGVLRRLARPLDLGRASLALRDSGTSAWVVTAGSTGSDWSAVEGIGVRRALIGMTARIAAECVRFAAMRGECESGRSYFVRCSHVGQPARIAATGSRWDYTRGELTPRIRANRCANRNPSRAHPPKSSVTSGKSQPSTLTWALLVS